MPLTRHEHLNWRNHAKRAGPAVRAARPGGRAGTADSGVLPPGLTPVEIDAGLDAGWIGWRYVQQSLCEILDGPRLRAEHWP